MSQDDPSFFDKLVDEALSNIGCLVLPVILVIAFALYSIYQLLF